MLPKTLILLTAFTACVACSSKKKPPLTTASGTPQNTCAVDAKKICEQTKDLHINQITEVAKKKAEQDQLPGQKLDVKLATTETWVYAFMTLTTARFRSSAI